MDMSTWIFLKAYISNVLGTLVCLLLVRIFIVYSRIHNTKKSILRNRSPACKIMIVLGSGGHTFEMLRLVEPMQNTFRPRVYVMADSDTMSEKKMNALEEPKMARVKDRDDITTLYLCEKIPRSREVMQSWVSSFVSTLYACCFSVPLVLKHMPEAILCNGPGTCVPICLVAFFLHVLGIKHIKVIYVESICRVKTMSLTGKILYHLADEFIVQWPQLKEKYKRARYLGRLI